MSKPIVNSVTWKIGGESGQGIMVTGLLFSKACVRAGLYAFDYSEYPSLIRGGHNTYLARITGRELFSQDRSVEVLVALNQETIAKQFRELSPGGAILYDPEDPKLDLKVVTRRDLRLLPIPLTKLQVEAGGAKIMRNSVAVGATFALLGLDFHFVETVIRDVFAEKGEAVISHNLDVFKAGYAFGQAHFPKDFGWRLVPKRPHGQLVMTGNDAIVLGAIQAGVGFYSGYPMTPSSTLLHGMASLAHEYGFVVKHAEDEISVANMAIGAGHVGVRSMCATAGGGFSLMVEAYGMAAATETPLVMVEAIRPGPSTGLPTWTGQGDLKFMLSMGQGEFPRLVAAAGDVEECFWLTLEAFNIAEKYQTPVVLITDKYLAESHATVRAFDLQKATRDRGKVLTEAQLASLKDYRRYDTKVADGVSPRSLPGMNGGVFLANSDEHDEYGFSMEDAEPVKAMMDKRMRKFEAARKGIAEPKLEGPAKADLTIVSWGSTKGPIKEAMLALDEKGVKVNFLQVRWMSPFPVKTVTGVIAKAKRVLLVENNQTGQFGQLIREQTGLDIKEKLLKYDGRPFYPEEIVERVSTLARKR